ncbi:hypothetical protein D048_1695 [Vibrio parahaemolyticus VPTS-2009]|nr:hypothetical protein VPUCM_0958 [Vibrio parahaemolyticus UCM-V493]EXJ29553.1 hypothetical protein D048_1695 [Vibrio parahaemolyticus VPTS-2009]
MCEIKDSIIAFHILNVNSVKFYLVIFVKIDILKTIKKKQKLNIA